MRKLMISYDYYRVFYYVCKYKNFTKAANVLLTSQSSISHTINNLEHQLGCRLFIRNNRGIELTAEGETLYTYVAIGCEQFMRGESELINSISLESGNIYLGATETALHCFLFDALDDFHQKYPKVRLNITNYSAIEAMSALKNGTVDLIVTATPFDAAPHMKTIVLKEIHDILTGGSMYKDLQNQSITLKELSTYPLICYSTGTKSRLFIEKIFTDNGLMLSPMIESAASDMIIPMIKHNLGLGFIPEEMVREAMDAGEIVKINTIETIPSRKICLVYDTQHPRSTASNELIHFLSEMRA